MSMNRIVMHHSGGAGTPNATDLLHYHRLIDAGGKGHDGKFPISANEPATVLRAGRYAAHTQNLNSGSIGVTVCAMADAVWADPRGSTRHFPTAAQVDGLVREVARLCRVYGIAPSRRTVLSHAEVQVTLGVQQRQKWDFDYDPTGESDTRDPLVIGDMLRARIGEALGAAVDAGRPMATPPPDVRPILRQGARGAAVLDLQTALGFTGRSVDGQFGPGTFAAVVTFQRRHQLLPDGVVGRQTWAALFPPDL